MSPTAYAAVDLGATSGRVMLGVLHHDGGGARVELFETGRFTNGPVPVPAGAGTELRWDVLHLWRGILEGLRAAGREAATRGAVLAGVGVDSWAVDTALLDADGALLAAPRCYRDPRLLGVADQVYARIPAAEHYAVNGLQHLAFTTEFQLVAGSADAVWPLAHDVLLVPDLVTYWLTGRKVAEVTNASTTGLLDAASRTWADGIVKRLGAEFPALAGLRRLLPGLVEAGTVVGVLADAVQEATGLGPVRVVAVASHDTASAVVGTPLGERGAYISSGTWSLVGLELDAPVLTEASRKAGFTNELGLDGTVRYLHNVMGLWVLDECVREWTRDGRPVDLAELLDAAAREPGGVTVVDLDTDDFLAPGDMPRRFAEAARRAALPVPETRPALARAVLDSLAAAYARTIARAAELAGAPVEVVHIVGGGARNGLLCRLTAEATRLPVVAGPGEAAAVGNVLVQARATGALTGGLDALRDVVAASFSLRRYEPPR
ncbi:rhamnulokinase [Xylanimonas sp. McL0601]|uniref:rhamnulokinase n=1 Tax=Xylanimonas sp. McL0601 TaxID=3414739 RepID=UPI003CFA587B